MLKSRKNRSYETLDISKLLPVDSATVDSLITFRDDVKALKEIYSNICVAIDCLTDEKIRNQRQAVFEDELDRTCRVGIFNTLELPPVERPRVVNHPSKLSSFFKLEGVLSGLDEADHYSDVCKDSFGWELDEYQEWLDLNLAFFSDELGSIITFFDRHPQFKTIREKFSKGYLKARWALQAKYLAEEIKCEFLRQRDAKLADFMLVFVAANIFEKVIDLNLGVDYHPNERVRVAAKRLSAVLIDEGVSHEILTLSQSLAAGNPLPRAQRNIGQTPLTNAIAFELVSSALSSHLVFEITKNNRPSSAIMTEFMALFGFPLSEKHIRRKLNS